MIALNSCGVQFDKSEHRYTFDGRELQGITSTLLACAFPKLYEGIGDGTLMKAAARGTTVHEAMQSYCNGEWVPPDVEAVVSKGKQLLDDAHLEPIAWEYLVTDFEKYASAIDIVCMTTDGEIAIVDIKTTSELNYDYVALQTGIYRRAFLRLNPALHVAGTYVLWLPVDNDFNFRQAPRLERLNEISFEVVEALKVAYENGLSWDNSTQIRDFAREVAIATRQITHIVNMKKAADDKLTELRAGLKSVMESYHIHKYDNGTLSLTIVPDMESQRIDTRKLKTDYPDIAERCTVTSKSKGYLKITVK